MKILPTIFHLTHRKAGSQWVAEVLKQCVPERFVTPKDRAAHFYATPLEVESIYPTVYVSKPDFDTVTKSITTPIIKFVVIRDLRDTLVSEYFSLKFSHPLLNERYRTWRKMLNNLNKEQGLLYLMDETLPEYADFQASWFSDDVLLIKYEDLLQDEYTVFEQIVEHCQLELDYRRLYEIIKNLSFETQTHRKPGQEDISSHQRKGIIGDWKNHFSQKIIREFQRRFGEILIDTGYETNGSWSANHRKRSFLETETERNKDTLILRLHSSAVRRLEVLHQYHQELVIKEELIQAQQHELAGQNVTPHAQKAELLGQQARIETLQHELIEKEMVIQSQHTELVAKEQVIQSLIVFRNSSFRYWQNSFLVFLKARLPRTIRAVLQRMRRLGQPKLGRFYHYSPVPQRSLRHYAQPSSTVACGQLLQISIVTPSFNQAQFLERTLTSVLEQGYPQLEYLVQDGASTDGTANILDCYRDRLTRVESCRDCGQADAINRAFRHTYGEIMGWLNSDDLLLPGTLAYVGRYFQEHPGVDVVYGHRVIIDEEDREIGRWVLPPHDDDVLLWADYVPQETLFWRRSIWEKAGGCVGESFHFALDWDLLLRFREAGAKFVRLPRFLAAFRVHEHQKTSKEIEERGFEEMYRLRDRQHGRHVSHEEAHRQIRGYMRKHLLYHALYRSGLLRY